MKASYEWLREFVPFAETPEQIRDLLTARAATVEDLEPLRSDLAGIVVARVEQVARHPESDHLWLTRVDAGGASLVDVVCGAANVQAGKLYPFAAVGTTLPDGLRVEKRKIRGAVSQGMLCSARELRLGADHEGIMEVDADVAPGTPLLDAVALGDTRLELDVLPNRPDLLSHQGLAREIAAATGAELRLPAIPQRRAATPATVPAKSASQVAVLVEDPEGCPRYAAAVIRGVTVGPSPDWLAARLTAVGARSINNVVDVTNYMLHGFGQPMHAFDLARVSGPKVVVRRARPGERIRTLDGVDRLLDSDMTVIADADYPRAIAGVIGGMSAEVTPETTDILLEVAAFDPRRVRRTRRQLGISTDASYRFERGVDAHAIPFLLSHAVGLLLAVAGGSLDSEPMDIVGTLGRPTPVRLRLDRVALVLGERIDSSEIQSLLGRLGFHCAAVSPAELEVTPPTWRSDVTGAAEVIEEIARSHGYDRFSSEIRPFRPGSVPDARLHVVADRIRSACTAAGLLEARPLPFVRSGGPDSIRVLNPLSADEAYLRRSILDTLVNRAELNLARMQRNVRLFEIGAVFQTGEGDSGLPRESVHVGILVQGDRRPPHFTEPHPPQWDEWDAKGLAESIGIAAFPETAVTCAPSEQGDPSDPLLLWVVRSNDSRIGEVRRLTLDAPPWAAPAFGVELYLGAAMPSGAAPVQADVRPGTEPGRTYAPIPAYPPIDVDVALIVPDEIRAAEVETLIRDTAGELLENLTLFDEFRGSGVPEGTRSLAWRLTFRHPERTLRDREIQGRMGKIVGALEAKLGIRQRTA